MKYIIAGSLAAVTLTFAGWAYSHVWWPITPSTPSVAKEQTKPSHTPPRQLLAHALHRLHEEALVHFHADPSNGIARMPVVYEKVLKDWQMPYFSPGELDVAESIPFKDDLEKIHAASLKDFASHQPVAKRPKEPASQVITLDELAKWDKNKRVWEAKTVDLVGLLKHVHPVAYISEHLPNVHDHDCEVKTRHLDEFEEAALAALEKGDDHFARSRDGVIRLMGAIRAGGECLNCHVEKSDGDLLGALSYTLRPAEYKRVAGWSKGSTGK